MNYILDEETITEMVTRNTISTLTQRARRLVESGRRMTVVTRWVVGDGTDGPQIATGLTLAAPVAVTGDCAASKVTFYLTNLTHFGYCTYANEPETASEVWAQYHRRARRNMTRMTIHGGRPSDVPTVNDRIVITHWDYIGTGRQIIVGFDPGPAATAHLPRVETPAKAQTGDRIQANVKGIPGNVLVVTDSAGIAWRRSTPDDDSLVTLRDFSWLAVDGGGGIATDILVDHAPLIVTQVKTPAVEVAYVGDLIGENADGIAANVVEVVNCEGDRYRRAVGDERFDAEDGKGGQEWDWVSTYKGEIAGRCTTEGLLIYTPLKVTETMHVAGIR